MSSKDDGALMIGVEFHALHRERSSYWLEDVYRHPFWEKGCTGKATRAQVIGFAFEKYHYIEAAFEHMGIAAANASADGKLVDSFIAHTKADQKLGHADTFLLMCRGVPPLSRREVNDALNVAKNSAEHLMLFMDGIDTYYGAFPTVPRLPSDPLSE